MFDLRKLEAFCSVYEQRSFSKAGEALFLSQPTISAHVMTLEKELGVKLLDRMGRIVLPTPAGKILYKRCIKAFNELKKAKSEISYITGEISGDVVIAASSIPAVFLLPDIVTSFLKLFTNVRFTLQPGDSQSVIKNVLDGDAMLGVVGAPEVHPELEFKKIVDDELVIVCSPNFDLGSNKTEFAIQDLLTWAWIMREEGSGTRKSFEAGLAMAGVSPRSLQTALKVNGTEAAVQYATSGLGPTVTSRLVVDKMIAIGKLREIVVHGLKLPRAFYSVQHRRREMFPAAAKFSEYLYEQTDQMHS